MGAYDFRVFAPRVVGFAAGGSVAGDYAALVNFCQKASRIHWVVRAWASGFRLAAGVGGVKTAPPGAFSFALRVA